MTTFWLNADFDLSLRPRPAQPSRAAVQQQVRALSVYGLLWGRAGDAVLLRAAVPDDYLEYLGALGIETPRPLVDAPIDPTTTFEPFGWNAEAIALNGQLRRPAAHPALEVVRQVNGRGFGAALEAAIDENAPCCHRIGSIAELEARLQKLPWPDHGWVVKANHGNAALGNRRLRRLPLDAADRRFVTSQLVEDDTAWLEPWLQRTTECCVVFRVTASGELEELRLHEVINSADGALIGDLLLPAPPGPWRDALAPVAERVARALARAGYFGPACFDAFWYHDGGTARLRPLCDLNARQPISVGIHRLWRDRLADRVVYWRFFNRAKLDLPDTPPLQLFSETRYDPRARRGVLLAGPRRIAIDGRWVAPAKLAVAFVGRSREEVLVMETDFRRHHER